MSDKDLIDAGVDAFIRATNTETAGGGLIGYRYMLEQIAWWIAMDHGQDKVAPLFRIIATDNDVPPG